MITVNGTFPGPTLEANWGDTFGETQNDRTNAGKINIK